MTGTQAGGVKARNTNYKIHGRGFYAHIGSLGGRAGHTGGFYENPARARLVGGKGGSRSRRGLKLLGIEPDGTLKYKVVNTGEVIYLKGDDHYVAGKKYTAEEWAALQNKE